MSNHPKPHIMKTHRILFLALIVSAAFAVSAQAGDRHRNKGNAQTVGSAPAHYSAPAIHSSSGFRSGGNRTLASSPRMTTRSMPQFSQRHFNSSGSVGSIGQRQFTPRTFNRSNRVARFQNNGNLGALQGNRTNHFRSLGNQGQRGNNFTRSGNNRSIQTNRIAQLGTGRGNRTVGNISPGHNHVFAQQSVGWHRDWDRHHDHFWNGHRCRWVNNSWFIFDIGFIPWFGWPYSDYYAYDYPYGYPYGYDQGAYQSSYYYGQNSYDSSDYDQGGYSSNDQSNYNDQGDNRSGSSNESAAAMVADLQDKLARAGYYHGQIDGVLGPETRHALLRYQSDKGLGVTGSLTMETRQSLGLASQGGEN